MVKNERLSRISYFLNLKFCYIFYQPVSKCVGRYTIVPPFPLFIPILYNNDMRQKVSKKAKNEFRILKYQKYSHLFIIFTPIVVYIRFFFVKTLYNYLQMCDYFTEKEPRSVKDTPSVDYKQWIWQLAFPFTIKTVYRVGNEKNRHTIDFAQV